MLPIILFWIAYTLAILPLTAAWMAVDIKLHTNNHKCGNGVVTPMPHRDRR